VRPFMIEGLTWDSKQRLLYYQNLIAKRHVQSMPIDWHTAPSKNHLIDGQIHPITGSFGPPIQVEDGNRWLHTLLFRADIPKGGGRPNKDQKKEEEREFEHTYKFAINHSTNSNNKNSFFLEKQKRHHCSFSYFFSTTTPSIGVSRMP